MTQLRRLPRFRPTRARLGLVVGAGLVLALAALAGARPGSAGGRVAGIKGPAATGMQITNLHPEQTLTVVVDFYRQGGGGAGPVSLNLPSISPGSAYNMYMPNQGNLVNGLYSAVISGDRPLAGMTRTEWVQTGAVALYNLPEAAKDVTLPLVLKDSYGHTSIVTVQNTDTLQARTARLVFTRTGELGPRLEVALDLPPGESRTLDLARDAAFAALPPGFFGSLRATAEAPVAVQAFLAVEGSNMAVASLLGVPSEQADRSAYLPLFTSGFSSSDTLVAIANPGSAPVTAELVVRGGAGSCQGRTYRIRTGSIAPGANILVYRWPGGVAGYQAELSGLPLGCLGSATITADGWILAAAIYVTGATDRPAFAGAYNAFTAAEGATRTLLPLYRKQHLRHQMTTGIQAMNLGDAPTEARITFAMQDMVVAGADCPGCARTIAPGEATSWYPPAMPELPADRYGSAAIDSDQPLAVVVTDVSLHGGQDAGVYRGQGMDGGPPPLLDPTREPRQAFAPIVSKGMELLGPVRPTPEASSAVPALPARAAVRLFLPIGFGG